MYTIIFQSATGNTRYLAKQLATILGEQTSLFDTHVLDPEQVVATEQFILMYPIHGFNASKEIVRFTKALPEHVCASASVHLIAVGCNTSWINQANSSQLRTILAEKQARLGLDRVIAMPLSIGVAFDDAIGKKTLSDAEHALRAIAADLKIRLPDHQHVPTKAKMLAQVGKIEQQAAKLFGLELKANDACITCGLCAKQCPARNISIEPQQKPQFHFDCSMCLKCV
ncbi:MAG: EFR1 family ferrodoxin, partial [Culicoidibacterales bacterium]